MPRRVQPHRRKVIALRLILNEVEAANVALFRRLWKAEHGSRVSLSSCFARWIELGVIAARARGVRLPEEPSAESAPTFKGVSDRVANDDLG